MKPHFKKLDEQVIVITGASSGIGLTTAQMAARKGASVVMAARSEAELRGAAAEIRESGGKATAIPADVSNPDEVEAIAEHAMREFGRIDTWVNNAGLGMYGRLVDQSIADKRAIFETNFWSVVYGCRAAVKRMRAQGGVIVNIGSEVSDRATPLLGMYSAAKHAVRAYNDALRMELEHDKVPIWVSLVKPGPIDTPFPHHARNTMDTEPRHAPPVYPPEEVAHAIVTCAQKPVREITVGGIPRLQLAMASIAPRVTDLIMETQMWSEIEKGGPRWSGDSLRAPSGDDYGRRRGHQPDKKMSLYTRAALSDVMRAAPLVFVGAVLAATVAAKR
ncbi:MAG TPA: SDR family oxidoreductase [Vicinamibacterales bacterium]|nr:SDR family oxidoreductase [Vicinamibacterales bacterium]